MFSSSVKTIGGAGFRCNSIKGSTAKQWGNFTPLQLNAVNQFTVQVVHTCALHESSRGWNRISKQIGQCRWSRMAGWPVGHHDWVSNVVPLMHAGRGCWATS